MSEADTPLVYHVEGPWVDNEADYILTESAEAAGRLAAEAAFAGWDACESRSVRGPRVFIQCYEMPRTEYEEATGEGED